MPQFEPYGHNPGHAMKEPDFSELEGRKGLKGDNK